MGSGMNKTSDRIGSVGGWRQREETRGVFAGHHHQQHFSLSLSFLSYYFSPLISWEGGRQGYHHSNLQAERELNRVA
jgi:hypothetical protein